MGETLLKLMTHMRWADGLVADALDRDAAPNPEALRLFAHIASVEHLWYSRIEGRPPEHDVWPALSIDAARALASRHADLFEQLVSGSEAAALSRMVSYRNSAGRNFTNSVGDIVTQVAMHGSHHRGQIARKLRESGEDPPYVDYIQFIRREQ